jgi:hypothetical protein
MDWDFVETLKSTFDKCSGVALVLVRSSFELQGGSAKEEVTENVFNNILGSLCANDGVTNARQINDVKIEMFICVPLLGRHKSVCNIAQVAHWP